MQYTLPLYPKIAYNYLYIFFTYLSCFIYLKLVSYYACQSPLETLFYLVSKESEWASPLETSIYLVSKENECIQRMTKKIKSRVCQLKRLTTLKDMVKSKKPRKCVAHPWKCR